jgi:hypothetical protein
LIGVGVEMLAELIGVLRGELGWSVGVSGVGLYGFGLFLLRFGVGRSSFSVFRPKFIRAYATTLMFIGFPGVA